MYASLRILSAGILIALVAFSPDKTVFKSIAWSITIAHYIVAVPYSMPKIRSLSADRSRWPFLAFLAVAFVVLWQTQFDMVVYFGVHHVLNEVYMMDRVTRAKNDRRVRSLRHAGLLLHATLYAALVNHSPPFALLGQPALLGLMAGGYGVFFLALWRARGVLSAQERFDHLALELAAVPIVMLALDYDVSVLHMSTYHVLFWMFFPAFSIQTRKAGEGMGRYLAIMGATCGALLAVSPASPLPHFSMKDFKDLFYLGAYFHITLTFALSDANPAIVKDLFRAKEPVPKVA